MSHDGAVVDPQEESVAEFSFRSDDAKNRVDLLEGSKLSVTSGPESSSKPSSPSPMKKKEIPLSQPDASSIKRRTENFIPYNPWQQDAGHLAVVESQMDEPVELTPLEKADHDKMVTFQGDNNARLKYADVLGFNFDASMKGSTPALLAHADEEKIVYSAGKHITCVGIEHTHRTIVQRSSTCITINTFDVSSNGKYIAVSERCTDAPYVNVYKIDSASLVASLNFQFLSKSQIVGLSFSSNNKYLATLAARPTAKLFLWQLDDVKVVATRELSDFAISAVKINPWQSLGMCSLGSSIHLWSIKGKDLVPHDPMESRLDTIFPDKAPRWSSIVWYDEDCVAAVAECGTLVAVEAGEARFWKKVGSEMMSPCTQVAWVSRGLIVAGSSGEMVLLDRTYSSDGLFTPVATLRAASSTSARIIALSVSPGETNVVVALSDNSMRWLSLDDLNDTLQTIADAEADAVTSMSESQLQSKVEHDARMAALGDGLSPKLQGSQGPVLHEEGQGALITQSLFKPLPHVSFHSSTVTSVSIALQRPLIVTTSADCTVRVYDYVKHRLVVSKTMEDEILSGAVHPMGLHMILGFNFTARVYAILEDDALQLTELSVKSAHEIRYSPTGARVAFALANRVVVHDGHSYAFLGMLLGHTTMIKSITWLPNDDICTSDVGGMMITWDGYKLRRNGNDSSQKNLVFQHALHDTDTGLYAAAASNKHARGKIFEGEFTIVCASGGLKKHLIYVRPGMVIPKHVATRKLHTTLVALSKLSKTLFVGTPTGRVLMYSWPLLATSRPYAHVDAHTCEIIHLHMTTDERNLITVGSDHVSYVFEISHLKDGKFVAAAEQEYAPFEAVRYMQPSDLDDLEREIFGLRRLLEERTIECEAHIEALGSRKAREMKKFIGNADTTLDELRTKIDLVSDDRRSTEDGMHRHTEKVESMYIHTTEDIESLYTKRMEDAWEKFRILESEKEGLIAKYETVLSNRIADGENVRTTLETKRRDIEKQLSKEVETWREKIAVAARKYDAMIAQSVVDLETEMTVMEKDHNVAMASREDKVQKAATYASFGDREAERQRKDITAIEQTLEKRAVVVTELQTTSDKKQREIKTLKTEMLSRQEAINVAEKSMQQLKQQLAVLENLRFVLTHQFDELQAEVAPKDATLRRLEGRITEMEEEMQVIGVERNSIHERVVVVDGNLKKLQDTQSDLKIKQLDTERKAKNLVDDLGRLQDTYRDPQTFARDFHRVVRSAKERFNFNEASLDTGSSKLAEELEAHRSYLTSKHSHQMMYAKKSNAELEEKNKEILSENERLVVEIKGLRTDRKKLLQRVTATETQLRDGRVSLQQFTHPRASSSPSGGRRSTLPATPSSAPKSKTQLLPPLMNSTMSNTSDTSAFSQKKVLPLPKKNKSAQRTQLEDAIHQLDANTALMKKNEGEINVLRDFVQSLLDSEEQRLVTQLRNYQTSASPAEFQGVTPGPMGDDSVLSPDWNVEGEGRPMSPSEKPPAVPDLSA